MPVLKNARHERFAQLVASGVKQTDAHVQVWPHSAKWKPKSVHEKASKLAAKVRPRIDEILEAQAKAFTVEKGELVKFLAEVVRTPVDSVGATSQLAQEVEVRTFGENVVTKVRMPSKLGAVSELAKLLGLYEPEKVKGTIRYMPDEATLRLLRK